MRSFSDIIRGTVWAEGGLRRRVPVPLGGGGAVPGLRDAAGQDTDGEHGELHLSRVPEAVGRQKGDRNRQQFDGGTPV